MKLAENVLDVRTRGVTNSKRFGIAQNAKMFHILSNQLYSQKAMAVIRELSTNASDAHIEAGNPNHFHVHLPNQADPVFRIRDFGVGLSEDGMFNTFSEYGESTKTDSNEVNGCLGLGSKSPFCYVKSFNVTSYFNGMKLCYICAMDEEGVPDLNFLHKESTTEPNGLEISFPVKPGDFDEFCREAMRVYHYFDNKPIITGGLIGYSFKNHTYSQRNIVISGEGWRVCKINQDNRVYPNFYNKPKSNIVAIMGNVAYPVEANNILGENKETTNPSILAWNKAFGKDEIDSWRKFLHEVLNRGDLYLEMDFPIGEIDFDPSRENLQYTKSVIATIRYRTQQIYAEIQKNLNEKIKDAKSKIEAMKALSEAATLSSGWNTDASWTDADGQVHKISLGKDLTYTIPKDKSLYVFNYRSGGYRSRRMIAQVNEIYFDTVAPRRNYYHKNAVFFVCDLASEETAKSIITRYCAANNCYAYMLRDINDPAKSGEGFDDLVKDIGGKDKLLKVSAYKGQFITARAKRSGTGIVSKDDVFLIHSKKIKGSSLSASYGSARYLSSIQQKDLDDLVNWNEVVYVPIIRYGSSKDFPHISVINHVVSHPMMIKNTSLVKDIFDQDIFAIKQSSVDKLKSKGIKLVDFNTYVFNKMKAKAKDISLAMDYNALENFYRVQANDLWDGSSYSRVNIPHCCLFAILNIFGYSYSDYLQKDTAELIDEVLLMTYFTNGHSGLYLNNTLNKKYSDKIVTMITNKLGTNGNIKQQDFVDQMNMIRMFNDLIIRLYGTSDLKNEADKLNSLLGNKTTKSKINTSNFATGKSIKTKINDLLDRSPVLRYNLAVNQSTGRDENILKIDENNPSVVFDTWNRRDNLSFSKMNLADLRKSFGSIIN